MKIRIRVADLSREQNLYVRSKELVGDRNPREEEFSI